MTERRSILSAAALGLAAAAGSARAQGAAPARPLAGRVAFVTGSARGIGRAAAVELARHGADVALLDIAQPDAIPVVQGYQLASRADLDEAAGLVRAEGVRALALVADVRDRDAMRAAAARALAELGGLDIVVANAGIGGGGKASEIEPERLRALLEVNVAGVVNTVQATLPGLRRRPGGRVVITTSVAARSGSPESGGYTATKWAATGLMKSFAAELGPEGITVNAVAPTAVDTVLFRRGGEDQAARAQQNEQARKQHVLPVGVLDPVEIAHAIAFLAGPDARYVSGMTLDVNAGRSAELTA